MFSIRPESKHTAAKQTSKQKRNTCKDLNSGGFLFLSSFVFFLSLPLSLSLSLSSFQQENRYHYGPEKDPAAWCFNLIQVLIFPIHFYMGAISLLRILRTSENINFTQKTRRRHWGQIEDSDKRTRRVACPL